MTTKLSRPFALQLLGGSRLPKTQTLHGCTGNSIPMKKINKKNDCSARKAFRRSKFKFKISKQKTICPAVMAHRLEEELEFVQFGPEECVPDLNKVDIRTIRNMMLLFEQEHCHVDVTEEDVKKYLQQSQLQSTEPFYGGPSKMYYANCRPMLLPPSKIDGTKTEAASSLLTGLIQKFGGSVINMVLLDCANNYSMTPHVYKIGSSYGYKAMELPNVEAAMTCACCGIVNLVWLLDETEGLTKSRCGVCLQPLLIDKMLPECIAWGMLEVVDITQLRVGAIELNNAEITLQLDGQPPLSAATLAKLIDQDLRNLRSVMSRAMSKTIYVPNGLTDYQKKELAIAVPAYKLLPMSGTPNPHAMLAAERRVCAVTMGDKLKRGKKILDIGTRANLTGNDSWHGMGPCLDWRDVERYHNKPLTENTCDHTVKECGCLDGEQPLSISVDAMYDIDPADVILLMNRTGTKQLFFCLSTAEVDFDRTNGKLAHGQGEWIRHEDKLVTVLRGDDRPYVNDWKLTKLWSTADLIQVGHNEISVQTVKVLGNHIIRVATLVPDGMDCLRTRQVGAQNLTHLDIVVPMIDVESWLNVLGPPKMCHKTMKLDLALYRALYSRNLTGGLSFEKLIEFGLGYAHAKYTTKTTTISHQHVTADDVRTHALLACAATRRKFAWVSSALKLNNNSNVFGLDPIEVTKLISVDLAGTLVIDLWQKMLPEGFIKNRIDDLVTQVTSWINDSFWDTLDSLSGQSKVFTPNVYVWPSTCDETVLNSERVCYHHQQWCDHPIALEDLCECCRLVTSLPNSSRCECCTVGTTSHACQHKCQGGHIMIGEAAAHKCKCCKLNALTDPCKCCASKITKHPDAQQPIGAQVYAEPQRDMAKKIQNYKYQGLNKVTSLPKHTQSVGATAGEVQELDVPQFEPTPTPSSIIGLWKAEREKRSIPTIMDGGTTSSPGYMAPSVRPTEDPTTNQSGEDVSIILPNDREFQKVVLELTGLTDFSYVSNLRFGYTESVASQLALPNEPNPEDRIGLSELKYFPMGMQQHHPDLLTPINTQSVGGDGLCAYYALEHGCGIKLSLEHMQSALNCKQQFSTLQIIKYGNMLGYNVAVLTEEAIITGKVDPTTDNFVCILHTFEAETGAPHWQPCNVVQTGDLESTPCYKGMFKQSTINKQLSLIPSDVQGTELNKELCKIVLQIIKRTVPKLSQLKFGRVEINMNTVNGVHMLSNNRLGRHDPGAGLFSFAVGEQDVGLVECLCHDSLPLHELDQLESPLNITTMYNCDINELRTSLMRNTVIQLRQTLIQAKGVEPRSEDAWVKVFALTHKIGKDTRLLMLQDTKIKSGDVISVDTMFGIQDRVVWKFNDGFQCLDWLPPTIGTQTIKIYINKRSFKSGLIKLMTLNRPHVKFDQFKELVMSSNCIIGPAGSGKSTMIATNWTDGTIAIAKTTSAVKNLQIKIGGPKNLVMSHEKYAFSCLPIHDLVIDECSMFTWFDLYFSLVDLPRSLTMYGDPHQISTIDTFMLGGERILDNITDYVISKHTLKTTYRYGASICALLSPIVGELSSKAKHDTKLVDLNLPLWDNDQLKKIVKEHDPDVILTHHNLTKQRLAGLCPNKRVETIHSFQSMEPNNVMVVQYNEGGNSKIFMDKRYAISAVTRAKLSMVWVSIEVSNKMTLLDKLRGTELDITGGGEPSEEKKQSETLQKRLLEALQSGVDEEAMAKPVFPEVGEGSKSVRSHVEYNLDQPETKLDNDKFVTMNDIDTILDNYNMSKQPLLIYDGWQDFVERWLNTLPKQARMVADERTGVVTISVLGVKLIIVVDKEREYYSLQVESPRWMFNVKNSVLYKYKAGLREEWVKHAFGKKYSEVLLLLRPAHRDWFKTVLQWEPHFSIVRVEPSNQPDDKGKRIAREVDSDGDEWEDALSEELVEETVTNIETTTLAQLEMNRLIQDRQLCKNYPALAELNYEQISTLLNPSSPMFYPMKSTSVLALVNATLPNVRLTTIIKEISGGFELTISTTAQIVAIITVTGHGLQLTVTGGELSKKVQESILELKIKSYNKVAPYAGVWQTERNLTDEQTQLIQQWYPWLTFMADAQEKFGGNELKALLNQDRFDVPGKLNGLLKSMREMHWMLKEEGVVTEDDMDYVCQICDDQCMHYGEEVKLESGSIALELHLSPTSTRILRLCSEWATLQYDIGGMFTLNIQGEKVKVAAFGGCSICSGLKFTCNNIELLRISPQRKVGNVRKIKINCVAYPVLLQSIMSAMHISVVELNAEIDNEPLYVDLLAEMDEALKCSWFELGMLLERISVAPQYLWKLLQTGESSSACTIFEHENEEILKELTLHAPNIEIPLKSSTPGHRSLRGRPIGVKYKGVNFVIMKLGDKFSCDNQLMAAKYAWTYVPTMIMVQRYFWMQLNRWPWVIAKLITLNGKLANVGLGHDFDMPINSLNLPLSYHEANNTAVNRFLVEKRGEAVLSTMKKTYHIVFVSKLQLQNYGPMLQRDCDGMPIEEQGCETIDQGFDMLTEQICLKYFYNGLSRGEVSQMITDYPYLSILTSSWANFCTPPDKKYAFRYHQNLADCNNMMEKMEHSYGIGKQNTDGSKEKDGNGKQDILECIELQHKEGRGPWFTNQADERVKIMSQNVLMGLVQCRLNPHELAELMKNGNKTCVHMIMPQMIERNNQLFGVASEDGYQFKFWYHNSSHLTIINRQLLTMFQTGQCVTTPHGTLVMHSANRILGHCMVKVLLLPNQAKLPKYVRPNMHDNQQKLVKFKMPEIKNFKQFITTGKAIEYKEVNMSLKLYRALSLRMLRPGTTIDDLLAYARTYSHTVAYTISSRSSQQPQFVTELMECCVCVYVESVKLNSAAARVMDIISSTEHPIDQLGKIKNTIWFALVKVLADCYKWLGLDTTVENLIELFTSVGKETVGNVIKNIEKLVVVRISKIDTADPIICYHDDIDQHEMGKITLDDTRRKVKQVLSTIKDSMSWGEEVRRNRVELVDNNEQHMRNPVSTSYLTSRLARRVGKDRDEELAKLVPEMSQQYNSSEMSTAVTRVIKNVARKLELRTQPNIVTCVGDDRWLSEESLIRKGKELMNDCFTLDDLRKEINEMRWMYPDECRTWENKLVIFSTIGSRGDIEPYIAWSQVIRELGAECKFLVPTDYVGYVNNFGFEALGLQVNSQDLITTCISAERSKWNPVKLYQVWKKMFELIENLFKFNHQQLMQFVNGADLVVETPFTHIGVQLAQKLKVPCLFATAYPWEQQAGMTTRADSMTIMEIIAGVAAFAPFKKHIQEWRQNMLQLHNERGIMVHGVGNPMVYLHPAKTKWWRTCKTSCCMGYANTMTDFIQEGDKELCILASEMKSIAVCFGSMTGKTRANLTSKLIDKLDSQFKMIVVDGSYPQPLNKPNVIVVREANYNMLFSCVDIVITHGGSGTTHNALRKDCVVFIEPHFGDQLAWMKSVRLLECGESVAKLLSMPIEQVMQKLPNWTRNAKIVGAQVRKEKFYVNLISNSTVLWHKAAEHTTNLLANIREPTQSLEVNTNNDVSMLKRAKLKWSDWETEATLTTRLLSKVQPEPQPCHQHSSGQPSTSSDKGNTPQGPRLQRPARKVYEYSYGGEQAGFDMPEQPSGIEVIERQELRTHLGIKAHGMGSQITRELPQLIAGANTNNNDKSTSDESSSSQPSNRANEPPTTIEDDQTTTDVEVVEIATANPEDEPQIELVTVEQDAQLTTTQSEETPEVHFPGFSIDVTDELTTKPGLILNMFDLKPSDDWGPPMEVISMNNVRAILEPKSQFECAKEVLTMAIMVQYELTEEKASHILQKCYQWLKIATTPRVEDMRAIICALDLTLGIKLPDGKLRFEHKGPTGETGFAVFITSGVSLGHCILKQVNILGSKPLNLQKCVQMELSRETQTELNELFKRYGGCGDWTQQNLPSLILSEDLAGQVWAELDTTYTREEFLYKLQGTNLVHTADRMDQPLTITKCRQSWSAVFCEEQIVPDRWYWVNDGGTWQGAIAVQLKRHKVLLVNSAEQSWGNKIVILRTDIRLGVMKPMQKKKPIHKKIIVPGDCKVTALNQSTLYESNLNYYGIALTGIQDDTCDLVAVYEYDNRAHHKYDDREFLTKMGPEKTIGSGFEMTAELWNKITNREMPLRHMIHKGKHKVALEFSNQAQRLTFTAVANSSELSYVVEGNCVYIAMHTLQPIKQQCLEEWATYMGASGGKVPHVDDVLTKYSQWTTLDKFLQEHGNDVNPKHVLGNVNVEHSQVRIMIQPGRSTTKLTNIVKVEMEYDPPALIHRNLCVTLEVMVNRKAGGVDEPEFWKFAGDFKQNSVSRWWDAVTVEKPKTKFDATRFTQINTEALISHGVTHSDFSGWSMPGGDTGDASNMPYVAVREWSNVVDNEIATVEIASYDIMSLWEDTDFSDWNEKFCPKNEAIVKSTIPATQLKVTNKYTMVQYPIYSRPVLTKAANQEFNAITGRLHNITTYRRQNYNVAKELQKFVFTYFDASKADILASFTQNKLTYSDAKVLDWLRDRPDSNKVAAELEVILQEGMQLHAINRLNVHLKLESLLKSEPANSLKQVKARALLWQCKGYCAIFSHIFKEAKVRLKQVLKPNIVYSDGLRADELSARVRLTTGVKYLLENDLAQQDKQTDHEIIRFEMALYKLLGVHEDVITLWHNSHFNWKYKSKSVRGEGDAMRLTGQATTALGNAITNMLVHRKLVNSLGNNLRLFLVLGDDGLMFSNANVDVSKLNNETKIKHNMMCKPHVSNTHGTFCCMIACITQEGNCSLGPDVVRLRRRFECPNGVSEITSDNALARAMSYYMMLGATPEVMGEIKTQNLPIQPMRWYDVDSIRSAVADKYNMSDEQVLNEERQLLKMLRERIYYKHEVLHWFEGM
ncbi:polyprotein [Hot pepper alphaendornavirus]|uniref:Polyprotein n=3 Tax=Hot pepper alphaendornavirus TaxID=1711684 RepID=A0A0M3SB60_9VIRU|nr:polyprotein [Hot pepper alphaendornavirus]ALD49085.1 polyprotein [Hot pepper alphaendornavirus]